MNIRIFAFLLVSISQIGCSLDAFVKAKDPEEQTELNRSHIRTLQGAMAVFNSSRGDLQEVISDVSINVGLLTDELTVRPDNHSDYSRGHVDVSQDVRFSAIHNANVYGLIFPVYNQAQSSRVTANQSRHLFRELRDTSLNYIISASYAIEAYAILIMAENLCSGIPLSEVPFEGKAIYGKSLRTDEVLRIAVAKFDSALQLTHDSIRYTVLAKIGKGRALLGLGEYELAADAVKDIQTIDRFEMPYAEVHTPNRTLPPNSRAPFDAFWTWVPASAAGASGVKSVEIVNHEGINGLIWYSDAGAVDPRVPVTTAVNDSGVRYFPAIVRQQKFVKGGVRFQLAKWAEAKMIEAEYRLNNNDANWVDPLNEARRSIGLLDTISPALFDEKVDLLFRERAYWFYGEGVRLADFRRLVRQYQRSPFSVYPIGGYTRNRSYAHYGDAFVYIPHISEYQNNGMYDGCFHQNP